MELTQKALSQKTNISVKTISNMETGKDISLSTLIEVLRALGQLPSIELMIPEQEIRPSQIAALGKERERARSKPGEKQEYQPTWKWGDEQ